MPKVRSSNTSKVAKYVSAFPDEHLQSDGIQPVRRLLSIKAKFELPREGLSDAELMRKSTSDRTKHRVAHEAWFPLPVIKKPIIIPDPKKIKDDKNKPVHIFAQCLKVPRAKTVKKRIPKKNGASVSPAVKKAKNDTVSVKKRKSKDLDYDVNGISQKTAKKKRVVNREYL